MGDLTEDPRGVELIRRVRAGDESCCEVDWQVAGDPHGCCLVPDHDGEHWCTCGCVKS